MTLYDLKNEDETKLYLRNLFTEYKFLCYHEKDAEGCQLLADFMYTLRKETESAAKLYKTNCDDNQYPRSCLKFADLSYIGRGCDKNWERALHYYKKGCELNHYKACLQGGALLTTSGNKNGIKADHVEGLKLYEKGCEGQLGLSCYYAGSVYITGAENVPRDMSKAFALTKKACDLGIAAACENVSNMYKKGDGVVKDEKLAELYKQKVADMNNQKKIDFQQFSS